MKRLIVTDSVSDIPQEIASQLGIKVIPVNVILDGMTYKDGVDLDKALFYENYDNYASMHTEAVTYEEYALAYMQLTQQYDELIIIHCSRHVSETFSVAEQVHDDFKDTHQCRVAIVDSQSLSMGLGMIVIEAARSALRGETFLQNLAIARGMIPRMNSYMAIPTLKYLKRGRKISGFKALFGAALGVKPVMTVVDGKPTILTKLFGRSKNMILSMMDRIRQDIGSDAINLAIIYSRERGVVDSLKGVFESSFQCKNVYVGRFGPSIGINTGPETTAVMFHKVAT